MITRSLTVAALATALIGTATASVTGFSFERREGLIRPRLLGASTTSGANESFREIRLNYTTADELNAWGGAFTWGNAPNGFASGRNALSVVFAYDRVEPDDIDDEFSSMLVQLDYQINDNTDSFQWGLTAGWTDFEDVGTGSALGVTFGKIFPAPPDGGAPFELALTGSRQEFNPDGPGDSIDDWVWDIYMGANLENAVRIDANFQTESDLTDDSSWWVRASFPINQMRSQNLRFTIGKDSLFKAEFGFKF